MHIPVNSGRGLGHDGDHRWGGCGACGSGETFIIFPGALELALRTLGSARREAVRQPGGGPTCRSRKQKPPQKRGRGLRVTAGLTDRHTCESLRPRNPSLLSLTRKRHYRFHPRRSYAQRSLTSESVIFQPHPEVRAGSAETRIPQASKDSRELGGGDPSRPDCAGRPSVRVWRKSLVGMSEA